MNHSFRAQDLPPDGPRPSRKALIAAMDFDGTHRRRAEEIALLALLDPAFRPEARERTILSLSFAPSDGDGPISAIHAIQTDREVTIPTPGALQADVRRLIQPYPPFHNDAEASLIYVVLPNAPMSAHAWLRLAVAGATLRIDLASGPGTLPGQQTKWRRRRFAW